MSFQTLILVTLKASIALSISVFAIGLKSQPNDAAYLLRRPAQLVRSLVAMDIIMPVVAVAIVGGVRYLPDAIEVSLVALAVSPAPPILQKSKSRRTASHPTPSDCWFSPQWSQLYTFQ